MQAADPVTSLTPSEGLIWTGQRLEPESPLYNMALALDVAGALDGVALRQALIRVASAADALRTVIIDEDGVPTRIVQAEPTIELDIVDVAGDEQTPDAIAEMLEERTRRRFALDSGLTDVALFRLDPDRSILYINQHHLITDASSTGLLFRALATEYTGVLEGQPPIADAMPQYAPYVERLRSLAATPHFERARTHWEQSKPTGTSETQFYGSTRVGSGRTQRVRASLGAERAAALAEVIQRPAFRALTEEHSRFLVFATVLAAWQARVTDRPDGAIGTPSHNRTTAEDRETLGLFIELYPLRLSLAEDETFTTLAGKAAKGTLDMMRHVVPGAGASPNARDFRVVLNYITARIGDFAGQAARADWIHSGFGDRKHALRLQVHDFSGSGVPTVDFDLDSDIFGDSEREWAVHHFFTLFDHLVAEPDTPIAAIPLVSWKEEAGFAPRGPVRPKGPGLLPRIAEQVREHPDDPAVAEGDRTISYRALARGVEGFAARLAAEGVGGGDVVAIGLERGSDQIAAMLGTLLSGAAYLPLDPAHPDERLGWQISHSGARVIVSNAGQVTRFEGMGTRALVHDFDFDRTTVPAGDQTSEVSGHWPEAPERALAYVLYTSGSTGRPKGVEVTHDSLTEYVAWASRTYDRGDRLAWAYFTSPAFDLTVTSILTPLVAGGSIVCYADPTEGRGLLVRDVIGADQVDIVKLTPSHLELLRDLDCSRSRIQRLVLGGEDLKSSVAARTHASFGGRVEIFNEYGPTEATVGCMIHRFDPDRDTMPSVPIGVPADNTRVHVLGAGGTPTLRGESGEIAISGARVARGYRNAPELTSAAFVSDPTVDGDRMYKTGDRGRWTAHGVLEFHGRRDEQIKIGGVRLEMGEIEAILTSHPAIREATARLLHRDRGADDLRCRRCGLESSHPEARMDDTDLCSICAQFEEEKHRVASYFGTLDDLRGLLAESRRKSTGEHDCIMLYSGGKDSTYALCRIVELGAKPLVFLLDNGFISDQAKQNARRVTDLLGLELVVGSTPAMPGIFAESLSRFSNVCQGCFKTVYTLALNLAVEHGISAIVTGLSRGQIFETRLADLYRNRIYDPVEVDRTIVEARKAYHGMDDAVRGLFDAGDEDVDAVLDRIRFIDFYRYTDVELDEMLRYVGERTPWIRPSDTGRSTNCLINEAGIFVHIKERGFHNYATPYSWDVRLGHKERDAAVAELDDDLDPANIRRMLDEVGYQERHSHRSDEQLVAYYTGSELSLTELRKLVGSRLPDSVIPSAFVHLNAMPLTASGKVDRSALPTPEPSRPELGVPFVEPRTPTEKTLAAIWAEALGLASVGVHDDFFELGGESLRCIRITSLARAAGLSFTPRDLFANPTVAALSGVVQALEASPELAPAKASASELDSLLQEFGQ